MSSGAPNNFAGITPELLMMLLVAQQQQIQQLQSQQQGSTGGAVSQPQLGGVPLGQLIHNAMQIATQVVQVAPSTSLAALSSTASALSSPAAEVPIAHISSSENTATGSGSVKSQAKGSKKGKKRVAEQIAHTQSASSTSADAASNPASSAAASASGPSSGSSFATTASATQGPSIAELEVIDLSNIMSSPVQSSQLQSPATSPTAAVSSSASASSSAASASASSLYSHKSSWKPPFIPKPVSLPPSKPALSTLSQPSLSSSSSASSSSATTASSSKQEMVSRPQLTQSQSQSGIAPAMEEYEGQIFLGTLRCKIVGIRYYTGIVWPGENVLMEREPRNPYDANAIKVMTMRREQVGHIERNIAAVLAPVLDRKLATPEAIMPSPGDKFALPMSISLYGKPESQTTVDRLLGNTGLWRSATLHGPASASSSSSSQAGAFGLIPTASPSATGTVDENFAQMFATNAVALSQLAPAQQPPLMKTLLHQYQLQGLAWMRAREADEVSSSSSSSVNRRLFWEQQRYTDGTMVWLNTLTKSAVRGAPEIARGGILADDMGLGKTAQMIALVLSDLNQQSSSSSSSSSSSLSSSSANFGTATLIVCPLSVIGNWESQIQRHVFAGVLNVCVYHGSDRASLKQKLAQADIVITTYDIIRAEYTPDQNSDQDDSSSAPAPAKKSKKKSKSPLFDRKWHRVVLDEAHIIRDANTLTAQAAFALSALSRSKWCISGTPIQNRVDDMYSLLRFLNIEPFHERSWWTRLIARPIKLMQPEGMQRLKMLISNISLRRRKDDKINGKPIINLPPKHQHILYVQLTPSEKKLYQTLVEDSQRQFGNLLAQQAVLKNYTAILEMLLRMRQACCHGALVPEEFHQGFGSLFSAEEVQRLKTLLARLARSQTEQDDCCVCLSPMADPVVTPCAHVFCRPCIEAVSKSASSVCPLCRAPFSPNDLVSPAISQQIEEEEKAAAAGDGQNRFQKSSKIDALIKSMQEKRASAPGSKFVVFSQWTSLLDRIETALETDFTPALMKESYGPGFASSSAASSSSSVVVRLDGKMNNPQRQAVLKAFREDEQTCVILISLKAGGVGLDLTAANTVYFMDPWWNASVEEQAEDRAYRLGQTQAVDVIRLIVKGSIEERVLDIQNEKRELFKSAFDNQKSSAELSQNRLKLLKEIFNSLGNM